MHSGISPPPPPFPRPTVGPPPACAAARRRVAEQAEPQRAGRPTRVCQCEKRPTRNGLRWRAFPQGSDPEVPSQKIDPKQTMEQGPGSRCRSATRRWRGSGATRPAAAPTRRARAGSPAPRRCRRAAAQAVNVPLERQHAPRSAYKHPRVRV